MLNVFKSGNWLIFHCNSQKEKNENVQNPYSYCCYCQWIPWKSIWKSPFGCKTKKSSNIKFDCKKSCNEWSSFNKIVEQCEMECATVWQSLYPQKDPKRTKTPRLCWSGRLERNQKCAWSKQSWSIDALFRMIFQK